MSAYTSDNKKAEIQRSTDIVDLISSYLPLKRAGKDLKGLCPFHNDKHPSLCVSREKQIFKCFACGAGGDVFSFVMKMEGVDFPEAMRMLAERAGIEMSASWQGAGPSREQKAPLLRANDWAKRVFQHRLSHENYGKPCRDYIASRGISDAMVERFALGFARPEWDDIGRMARRQEIPEQVLLDAGLIARKRDGQGTYDYFRNRLMFPIAATDGRVVGFGGRALDDNPAKYLNSPETAVFSKGRMLYGIHQAREAMLAKRQAVVVEGYTDVIMAHQCGVENVVAVLGTALTADHVHLLRRFADEVVLIFDGDEAGQRAANRSLDIFVEEGLNVRLAAMPEGVDPFDMLAQQGAEPFLALVERAHDAFSFKLAYLGGQFDTTTLDGKAAAVREMLTTVLKSPDSVRQDLSFKRIAEALGIAEPAVRAEADKLRPRRPKGRGAPSPPEPVSSSIPSSRDASTIAQRELVAAMLNDNKWIEDVKTQVGEEGFSNGVLRLVARHIFDIYSEQAVVDAPRVMERISDPAVVELIADICADEGSRVLPEERIRGDIDHLANTDLPRRMLAETKAEFFQAEQQGDEDAEKRQLVAYEKEMLRVKGAGNKDL